MKDIWHFPRTEQAMKIIEGMKHGLLERVSIFAIRKSGKTAFVLKDLLPLAEKEGWLVIYVDFWDNKSNPEEAFVQFALKSIQKNQSWLSSIKRNLGMDIQLGLDSLKLGVKRNDAQPKETTLAHVFQLIDSQDKPVLFLLDEVQHLASSKEFDNFTSSLRSHMVNRQDYRIKAVFTGSRQEDLSRLFRDSNAPFFDSAQTHPFTPLGESFVKYELDVFKQVTQGKELELDHAIQLFKGIDSTPGRFVELLKQMALNQVYCIKKGHELFMANIMDAEMESHNRQYAALSGMALATLKGLIKFDGTGVYRQPFYDFVSAKVGFEVKKHHIQKSIQTLANEDIIFSQTRGSWIISDPTFAKYITMAVSD